MREAENMTDRSWSVSDISSQSLAVILQTDVSSMRLQRRLNHQVLTEYFPAGRPLINFAEDECPLLHNRLCESREERDSLRTFLAQRHIFASIHWPVHDYLLKRRDSINCEAAIWLQDHLLSLPGAECLGLDQMETICDAAHDWVTAGGQRFVPAASHSGTSINV